MSDPFFPAPRIAATLAADAPPTSALATAALPPAPPVTTPTNPPPTVGNVPTAAPGLSAESLAKEGLFAQHQTFDPDFPAMLNMAVPFIVTDNLDRTRAIASLRSQAATNGEVGSGMGAYLKYGLAQLDALTAAAVDDYRIKPAEFTAWKIAYAAPPESTAARPVGNPSLRASSTPLPRADKRTILPPNIPVGVPRSNRWPARVRLGCRRGVLRRTTRRLAAGPTWRRSFMRSAAENCLAMRWRFRSRC